MTSMKKETTRGKTLLGSLDDVQRFVVRFQLPNLSFIPPDLRKLKPAGVQAQGVTKPGMGLLKRTSELFTIDMVDLLKHLDEDHRFTYARVVLEHDGRTDHGKVLRFAMKREADEREAANYTIAEIMPLVGEVIHMHATAAVYLNPDPLPRTERDQMLLIDLRVEDVRKTMSERGLWLDSERFYTL
jgi:hypothetical protein